LPGRLGVAVQLLAHAGKAGGRSSSPWRSKSRAAPAPARAPRRLRWP